MLSLSLSHNPPTVNDAINVIDQYARPSINQISEDYQCSSAKQSDNLQRYGDSCIEDQQKASRLC
jgi:hypothetical protein